MADLVTTITETVTLNGSLRGSSNTVTTANIIDVFERIVTCIHSQTTTVAVFDTAPYTSAGAIDVENVRYIRVTNLDPSVALLLAVVTTGTNYQVRLTAGTSHILSRGAETAIGETDVTPAFGTMQDITSLQVRPEGATTSPQVAVFVGAV